MKVNGFSVDSGSTLANINKYSTKVITSIAIVDTDT